MTARPSSHRSATARIAPVVALVLAAFASACASEPAQDDQLADAGSVSGDSSLVGDGLAPPDDGSLSFVDSRATDGDGSAIPPEPDALTPVDAVFGDGPDVAVPNACSVGEDLFCSDVAIPWLGGLASSCRGCGVYGWLDVAFDADGNATSIAMEIPDDAFAACLAEKLAAARCACAAASTLSVYLPEQTGPC